LTEDSKQTIRFEYEKSPFFRSIHVDGGHGGPTASGLLQLALYSERLPIPKATEHTLDADGRLAKEVKRESRNAIYREIEVSAIMTLETAKAVHAWLGRHIDQLEAGHSTATEEGEE
jgi:hypothetical protein